MARDPRMLRRLVRGAAVAAVVMAVAVGNVSAGRRPPPPAGPTVVHASKTGPLAIPGSYATMATRPLAAGRWFVTAKAYVQAYRYGSSYERTSCLLVVGSRTDVVRVTPRGGGDRSSEPILLSLTAVLADADEMELRCLTSADAGDVVIRHIRLTAMRVGELTQDDLALRETPTVVGSGRPRVSSAWRSGGVGVPGDGQWHLVGAVEVSGAPPHWTLAEAVVRASSAASIQCRLWGFHSTEGVSYEDETEIFVHGAGNPSESRVVGLQAMNSEATSMNFECRSNAEAFVSRIRVTAMQTGRLSRRDLGGSPVAGAGSGWPRVIVGTDEDRRVAAGGGWQPMGGIELPAGAWVVHAKAVLKYGDASAWVRCRTTLGTERDQQLAIVESPPGGFADERIGMYFEIAHHLGATDSAAVWCRFDPEVGQTEVYLEDIVVTVIKAGILVTERL